MSLAEQSLQFFPVSARVSVLRARGLRVKGKDGTNDAYAALQAGRETFRTSVSEKRAEPVWGGDTAAFIFTLPPESARAEQDGVPLQVRVLHRVPLGADKLLGLTVIDVHELRQNSARENPQWFKLLNKAGKADKERGEILLDIQFLKSSMSISMIDLSDKSHSRLGKFKDKLKGKKKEGLSDSASAILPSVSQVLTDSEGEMDGEMEGESTKKKKNKLKSLFVPKSNMKRNSLSQSMSSLGTLPDKNSSISSSTSSGLNVDSTEGKKKKKFPFLTHKRSGSTDSKVSNPGDVTLGSTNQNPPSPISICINGNPVFREETQSEDMQEMEEVEEEEQERLEEERRREAEEEKMRQVKEEERKKEEEKERIRMEREKEEQKRRMEEEGERLRMEEEEQRRMEEKERERLRMERQKEEQRKLEEERERLRMERQKEEQRKLEEERERLRTEERERLRMEKEEQRRMEEERERLRMEEEERERLRMERQKEEQRELEEERERLRMEAQERLRMEEEERERLRMERQKEEQRKLEEERERLRIEREKEEQRRIEEEQEVLRMEGEKEEQRRMEEERERIRWLEQEKEEQRIRMEEEGERIRMEREKEEQRRMEEEEERIRMEREKEEQRRMEEEEERIRMEREKEEQRRMEEEERIRMEREKEEQRRMEEEGERIRMEREEEEQRRMEEEGERIRMEREKEEQRMEEEEKERIRMEWEKEEQRMRIEEEEKERIRLEKEAQRRKLEQEEKMRIAEEEGLKEEKKVTEGEQMMKEEEKQKLTSTNFTRSARISNVKPSVSVSATVSQLFMANTNPFLDDCLDASISENVISVKEAATKKRRAPLPPQKKPVLTGPDVSTRGVPEQHSLLTEFSKRPAPQPPGILKMTSEVTVKENTDQVGLGQEPRKIPENYQESSVSSVSQDDPQVDVNPFTCDEPVAVKHKRPAPKPGSGMSMSEGKPRNGGKNLTEGTVHLEEKTSASNNQKLLRAPNDDIVEDVKSGLTDLSWREEHLEDMVEPDSAKLNAPSCVCPEPLGCKTDGLPGMERSQKKYQAPLPPAKPKRSGDPSTPHQQPSLLNKTNLEQTLENHSNKKDQENLWVSSVEIPADSTPSSTVSSSTFTPLAEKSQVVKPCAIESVETDSGSRSRTLSWAKVVPSDVGEVREQVAPTSVIRQHAVKPLSAAENLHEIHESRVTDNTQPKTKAAEGAAKGPYSQLTQAELISLALSQQEQLSQRDARIQELERYIDNLLVRVIEEKPSILMTMNAVNKSI